MPWIALPLTSSDKKKLLSEKFGVNGIPCLVVVNLEDGSVKTKEGRALVGNCGGDTTTVYQSWL